jgi:hypothetical protein
MNLSLLRPHHLDVVTSETFFLEALEEGVDEAWADLYSARAQSLDVSRIDIFITYL